MRKKSKSNNNNNDKDNDNNNNNGNEKLSPKTLEAITKHIKIIVRANEPLFY